MMRGFMPVQLLNLATGSAPAAVVVGAAAAVVVGAGTVVVGEVTDGKVVVVPAVAAVLAVVAGATVVADVAWCALDEHAARASVASIAGTRPTNPTNVPGTRMKPACHAGGVRGWHPTGLS
jgi:hypothetical protein